MREKTFFHHPRHDGTRLVLAPVDRKARACFDAADSAFHEAVRTLTFDDDLELLDDDPDAGFAAEADGHLICWQILSDTCRKDGSCCFRTELGLVLGYDCDPDEAATAHLAALSHTSVALAESGRQLISAGDEPAPECCSTLTRHCRALQLALEELSLELAVAACVRDFTVQVDRP